MKVSRYAKAIVGAVIAAGSALVPALADDKLTSGEVITAVVAGLAALAVVWAVPNAPAPVAQSVRADKTGL
jgi:hypothetical protein